MSTMNVILLGLANDLFIPPESHHRLQLMVNDVSGVTGRVMTEPMGLWKVLGKSFNL